MWHAGIKRITVLGRSGRFDVASDLAHAMCNGWAASVAVTKCDVAFAEDTSALFSTSGNEGQLHAQKGVTMLPTSCAVAKLLLCPPRLT